METEEPKKKEALTSYYRKYYLANREKLLERSKQRYRTYKQTKDDLSNKSNHKSCSLEQATLSPLGRGSEAEPKKEEPKAESSEDDLSNKSNQSEAEVFQIDDLGTPNKTTIEKIKELFNVVKTE
jgi:hypothetical protein